MRAPSSSHRWPAVVAALALAAGGVLGLLVPRPVHASAATTGATTEVPVAGTFSYHVNQDAQQPLVRGAVHAVRRLIGATVVYYSLGFASGDKSTWFGVMPPAGLADDYGPYDVSKVAVVDTTGLTYYQPLVANGHCLCSQTVDFTASAGTLVTGFAVLPELPAGVDTVSVDLGYGTQVDAVPVGAGALTPQSTAGTSTALLGSGWPALPDAATIAAVKDPKRYVRSLVRSIADTDRTVTTKERPGRVEVDLAADVLFAVDASALSPAAQAKLALVAADITRRGTGVVTITGYTDATGDTAHNQALSQARARSVLAGVKPRVTKAGLSFTAAGKGEAQPVADNGSTEGRRLNRRVTISYRVGGTP
ncbi:MAG: OmpA family protein [Cellulomonas sp.]|nr:OmpA family protein [Cellulomonas sp.]